MNFLRQFAIPSIPRSQRDLAREFLDLFPAATYRIQTIKRTATGRTRNFAAAPPEKLLELVDNGTLAHANVNSSCVFARPVRRDLILIDDLPPHAIPTLRSAGLEPLAVIQSSPHKTNTVLHFPTIPHDNAPLHQLVQRSVVETLIDLGLPADAAAARDLQVWRLPGFSNQKRNEDGSLKYEPRFFAKLLEIAPGTVPRRADEFVARAAAELEAAESKMTDRIASLAEAHVEGLDGDVQFKRLYAPRKYLDAVLLRAANAPEGQRNWTLYCCAYSLFRLCHGCGRDEELRATMGLERESLQRELMSAGLAAGLGLKEIEPTIASAWRGAARRPVVPEY